MFGDEELPPPPPAYSEQEFDRKISTALEVSLTITQPTNTAGDEEWEEWDDSAFEAAQRALQEPSQGSSSSNGGTYPTEDHSYSSSGRSAAGVAPLRIHKKTDSNASQVEVPQKPRPAWYNEAGLGESSSSASGSQAPQGSSSHGAAAPTHHGPTPDQHGSLKPGPSWYNEAGLRDSTSSNSNQTSHGSSGQASLSPVASRPLPASPTSPTGPPSPLQPVPHHTQSSGSNVASSHPIRRNSDDYGEEEHSAPPPPFTAVGPSLDGPPFEEVAGGGIVGEGTLTYNPAADGSPPPSPLTSPVATITTLPHLAPVHPRSHAHSPSPSPQPPVPAPVMPLPQRVQTPVRSQTPDSYTQMHPPPRQSMPPPARAPYRSGKRPATMASSNRTLQLSTGPQLEFNPSVAYSRRGALAEFPVRHAQQGAPIDATAFYNSAVSAQMKTPAKTGQNTSYHAHHNHYAPQNQYYEPQQQQFNPSSQAYTPQPAWPGNAVAPRPTYPAQSQPSFINKAPQYQYPAQAPVNPVANQPYKRDQWNPQNQYPVQAPLNPGMNPQIKQDQWSSQNQYAGRYY